MGKGMPQYLKAAEDATKVRTARGLRGARWKGRGGGLAGGRRAGN